MEMILMQLLPPKKIRNKVIYINNDVVVRDGIRLNSEEEKIYRKFREELKKALEDRFEE